MNIHESDDGWRTHRGDDGEFMFMSWFHEPSGRSVTVDECARHQYVGPTWGAEPVDRRADGFHVVCRVHDALGNPESGEGFWVESFALAIKLARKYREAVEGQRYRPDVAVQLTLDDALGGGQ